jgi:DNA polymerase III subunit epsilon
VTNLHLPLSDVRFVVVDVESTGGTSGEHRLIEIAMVVVEDGVVVARHESLVDPHEDIPDFIQRMTGITDEMVKGAPEEEEALAPVLRELQDERAVFVAHNVGFDWGFIQRAVQRMSGIVPDVVRLCTCKLSRRLHVDLPRHDLASVAEHCGVVIDGRHRAMGDTMATVDVLVQMIDLARGDHGAQTLGDLVDLQYAPRRQPRRETRKREELAPYLAELPDEPGVYYFLSAKRKLLYVGKAKSLVRRVRTYFHDAPLHGRSVSRMLRFIKHIEWTTTDTELGALLLESREIKTRRPTYNVASREYTAPSFLRFTRENFPRLELVHDVDPMTGDHFGPFRSRLMAERIRDLLMTTYRIRSCEGALVPSAEARPCFDYHVKKCLGPCALHQSVDDYRARVHEARDHLAHLENGAVAQLRDRMQRAAEEMAYEEPAMLRDGIREIERLMIHGGITPLAVHDINVVLLLPTAGHDRTFELYALREGRLAMQRVMGRRAPLQGLADQLVDLYNVPASAEMMTEVEIDELRIITAWMHQHREHVHAFTVDAAMRLSSNHVLQELQRGIASTLHATTSE